MQTNTQINQQLGRGSFTVIPNRPTLLNSAELTPTSEVCDLAQACVTDTTVPVHRNNLYESEEAIASSLVAITTRLQQRTFIHATQRNVKIQMFSHRFRLNLLIDPPLIKAPTGGRFPRENHWSPTSCSPPSGSGWPRACFSLSLSHFSPHDRSFQAISLMEIVFPRCMFFKHPLV